jgi:hypothetical protein
MIIWSEKQYKRFCEQTGRVEAKPEAQPIGVDLNKPVVPAMTMAKPEPKYVDRFTRPVFIVCLTVIAVVGMVHEKPINATSVPVKVEQVAKPVKHKIHHAKKRHYKKCACECKKVVDKPAKSVNSVSIENVEERLTDGKAKL